MVATMITRDEAIKLVETRIQNQNLRKHILAVEVVMKYLARELNQPEDTWAMAGLLHDLDYEETKGDPARHTLVTAELLAGLDVPPEVVDAIKAHADKKPRVTLMEKAIYCADPVTGFLVACALIRPTKKLEPIDPEFAIKRMKEKRFAAGANRNSINTSAELGLPIDRFFAIALVAMKSISAALGL